MLDIPSRSSLAALIESAAAALPSLAIGFTRLLDDSRVSILYCGPHGIGEFVIPGPDLPDVLLPSSEGPRQADATVFNSNSLGAIEQFLHVAGVQRIASLDLAQGAPAARLWIGLLDATPLTADDFRRLEPLVDAGAALLNTPSSPDETAEQRRRLELAEGLLPSLLRVLDVREVFERLSVAAKRALPHDVLLLFLFDEDFSKCTLFARSDRGPDLSSVLPNPYPAADRRAWAFQIVDDHSAHPMERETHATKLGARSSLRVPIRFDERVIGGVAFVSFERAKYTSADVAIGRRLADYVAIGLSHYQLAEESRQTAALRERAANLEMLDGLLATLAGVLDIREVFDRVSVIAQKVLPHDAVAIVEVLEGGERVRHHTTQGLAGLTAPYEMPVGDRSLLTAPWEFQLIDDLLADPKFSGNPAVVAGMRSVLFVPIRMEGALWGALNFYSKTRANYSRKDVLLAKRIADHVALALSHQRLAEQARRNEELRARAEKAELIDEIVASLTGNGELPEILDHISTVTRRVLDHDAMVVAVRLPDGKHARIYASVRPGNTPFPETLDAPPRPISQHEGEYDIVDDFQTMPEYQRLWIVQQGYRSALRLPINLDNEFVGGLALLSFTPGIYGLADLPVARRIAERVTVSFAPVRARVLKRRADEAGERAARLEARVRALTEELDARTGYRRVIGDSAEWRAVLTQATQVAANETTVLLLGESGTGKEVVARFVHRASPRVNGPFVALNCAALPEQLLEAELFGYERGAFTGAVQSKPGQLEQAAGGTLFLDEVGEMSLQAQAKFLRVLQEREFQRLGGTRVLRSGARIIAATNRDLARAITQNQFREDLYYRLNVFAISLPALRDRRSDILPLSDAFLAEIGRSIARPAAGISRDARKRLLDYHWPGNVRELRNILERASILCDGGLIAPEHLAINPGARPDANLRITSPTVALGSSQGVPQQAALSSAGDLKSLERDMIEQALQRVRFNKSRAAKDLGLTRQQLYLRMKKYGLE